MELCSHLNTAIKTLTAYISAPLCSNIILKGKFFCHGVQETANLNHEPESLKEPERVTPVSSPKEENVPETDNGDSEPVESKEESNPEENPVMNFFKTLVSGIIWQFKLTFYAPAISVYHVKLDYLGEKGKNTCTFISASFSEEKQAKKLKINKMRLMRLPVVPQSK